MDSASLRLALTLCLVSLLSACYYIQAARGQLDVMSRREPIPDVVTSDSTSAELAERLRLIATARQFSIDELGLPDNDSYRSYADLERDFVVWNVIAAPEFSLQPKRWCYPIVGCVSYRGYFVEKKARRKAEKLSTSGYDVVFGGVAAYSTLGRFDDPILNTMMRWEDTDLVAIMFHELAHQVVYIKDDSTFNESFATAVEEFGVERWLAQIGQDAELDEYRARQDLRESTMVAIDAARSDLEELYAASIPDRLKRKRKQRRLEQLAAGIATLYAEAGWKPPAWLNSELNNARLVSMTLYHGELSKFRALLAGCNDDIRCFYAEAEKLSRST